MKAFRLLVILAISLFAAETAMAANYFIRAGSAGANNGTDWVNAYTALPATLVRGSTYYIAAGSYSGRTFNTPTSGTSAITIKGATITDHGTDMGWNNSYSVENTQATWTSGITFNTSYWVFDGSVGPVWSTIPSQYGFAFSSMTKPISIYNTSTAITDITVSHIAATAPAGDVEKFFVQTDNSTKSVHNVTISHCFGKGWSNFLWATSAALAMNNWIVEYNIILNGYSSAAVHGEDINNNYGYFNPLIVRYNWFGGRTTGTACITVLNAPSGPYYIYGNVFKDMIGGDGIISGIHYALSGAIYNNTFINCDNGYRNGCWIGHDVAATVYNNIVANSIASIGANFTGTKDYNAYFNTTSTPSETHGQVGAVAPFISVSNPRLTTRTNSGYTLPSPYNYDVDGNVRGSDGSWGRGAFEFGNNNPNPAPPKAVRIE